MHETIIPIFPEFVNRRERTLGEFDFVHKYYALLLWMLLKNEKHFQVVL